MINDQIGLPARSICERSLNFKQTATATATNIRKLTMTYRRWHEIILWWELRRIPYNVIMYIVGLLSFQIGYVTIPLVYIIMGLGLNVLYTLGWIIELLFIDRLKEKEGRLNYPQYAFISYLTFSTLVVFAIPLLLLIR